ncbi:MAG: hypothetical protein RMI94_07270 [Bryobacterales bacterium]|nr:hypothetical protein [Bryobacteraceae bacterium]MDW8130333.1 hypothetical protein [Bryobacterales bacterium]
MHDLRLPSGLFFTLVGAILCLTALIAPGYRAPLTEFNVNLYAGMGMLLFGGVMLWLGLRRC